MRTSETIAGYRLVSVLGQGIGANVHLAYPPPRLAATDGPWPGPGPREGEPVALKVLDGRYPPYRFQAAARRLAAAAQVRSAFLAPVYEIGQDDGRVWISMAHHTYGSLVTPAQPLNRRDRLTVVASAARGAHDLHEAGVAHGDIKPSNILLAADGARLADIELRSVLTPGLTLYATPLLADVEFTDPAVIRGLPTSRASDIWSLGMTLHRILAGQPVCPPGADDDMLSTISQISSYRLNIAPTLSAAEQAVVQSCLAADPSERPATAAALAAAIEELL